MVCRDMQRLMFEISIDVYSIGRVPAYPGNTMDTTQFVLNTNTMIQHICLGDIRVRVSCAMSLHRTEA